MTNSWTDIGNADLVLVMGGNAAEAHPCGFKWVTEAKHNRGAKLMVVDPRFTRTAAVADHYAPIRPGTDIAFLSGVINYLLTNEQIHQDYVLNYTNAAYIVKDGYGFEEGLFTGYDEEKRTYDRTSWEYEIGPDGFAVRDMTLAGPALRVPAAEGPRRAVHARGGRADHRHAAGQVPDGRASGSARPATASAP